MPLSDGMLYSKTAVWTSLNKHYRTPFAGEQPKEPRQRDSIIGPTTTAFPLNEGWYATGQTPRKTEKPTRNPDDSDTSNDDSDATDDPDAQPRCLSDLTISAMTKIVTSRISKKGQTVEDARPNCEAVWASKWPPPFNALLKTTRLWDTIWDSIGTPFSDPTEEKAWLKLLHRAWNASNHHPTAPHHNCRLGCGNKDESMYHMLTCRYVAPLWQACVAFTNRFLSFEKGTARDGAAPGPTIRQIPEAVLFNVVGTKLLPQQARAFLRHALGQYYAEATHVKEDNVLFRWQRVYARTLARFRDAVVRWAKKIQLHFATRTYSTLTELVPREVLFYYSQLVKFEEADMSFTISQALDDAVKKAQEAAEAHDAQQAPRGLRP